MTTRSAGTMNGTDTVSTQAGPTILRHRLGTELRRLRETRALRLEDVAAWLGVAPSTMSRIETGKAPARTSYIYLMLDFYGVEDADQRRHLVDLAREGQRKGWWADHDDLLPRGTGEYLGLESAATEIRTLAIRTIPSLLQTADYAAAVIQATSPDLGDGQLDALVTLTLRRQSFSHGQRSLHAIIDESALLRAFGSPAVMAAQLDHLAHAIADPVTTVQILRLTGPQQIIVPGFTILGFPEPADTDVACRNEHNDQLTLDNGSHSVNRLREIFERLTHHAASADRSADLIRKLHRQHGKATD